MIVFFPFFSEISFFNHALYWGCLMPNLEENPVAREPTGALREEIEKDFGSYQAFKEEFTKQAVSKFGSGGLFLPLIS